MPPSDVPRRDALLAAALECVAEMGFEGMRLRDVAGRAGIDHSTLHHHFATKEKLIDALVAEVVGRFRPTMPATGVPRQRLHDHLAGLAVLIVEQPMLFAVMSELDQRAYHDPRVRAVLLDHERGWRAVLGDLFRERPWAPGLDVDAAVELVIATVKGVRRSPVVAPAVLAQLEKLLAGTS